MPRFAILEHDFPTSHWDFFLEAGPVLRTWRLPGPIEPDVPMTIEPIGDHRLLYLDYEGPVSGNRGTVKRIDTGDFEWVLDTADRIVVRLAGRRYVGRVQVAEGKAGWVFQFTASGAESAAQ